MRVIFGGDSSGVTQPLDVEDTPGGVHPEGLALELGFESAIPEGPKGTISMGLLGVFLPYG